MNAAGAGRADAADLLVFAGGGLLVFAVTRAGVPWLAARGWDPFAAWMLLASVGVFVPLIGAGLWLLRREGPCPAWRTRLRLARLSPADWRGVAWGSAAIVAGAALMSRVDASLGLSPDPFARAPQAWGAERWWMFAAWALYWPLNILGEEFTWRGVILPRMEARWGARAWRWNAGCWALFHVGFGLGNVLVVAPTLVLLPWLAQRRRSTVVGVLLHVAISLPGMLAIALGLV